MRVEETIKKSFLFSVEDSLLVEMIIRNKYSNMKVSKVMDDSFIYLPLFSAYGKIAGVIGMPDHEKVRFSPLEKQSICDLLRDALKENIYDHLVKGKITELLEGIFNNA